MNEHERWYFEGLELGLRTALAIADPHRCSFMARREIEAQIERVVKYLNSDKPAEDGLVEYASWLKTNGDIEIESWEAAIEGMQK